MILSKSNVVKSSELTLNTGSISSGSLANVQNSDFSSTLKSSSDTFKFTVSNLGFFQYFAFHGLTLPIGAVFSITGSGLSKSYTVTRDIKNIVFYLDIQPFNDVYDTLEVYDTLKVFTFSPVSVAIQVTGAGEKTISYIQAGLTSSIDWGTNAGQNLAYLSHNKRERARAGSRSLPLKANQDITNQRITVKYPTATKAWARADFQEVLKHYNTDGIVSMIDYEDDNKPEESNCLFDLNGGDVNTHPQTLLLADVSMSFRVSA